MGESRELILPSSGQRRVSCGDLDAEKLAGRSTSTTTQAKIQGFELALPNLLPIVELLKHVKGLALRIHSHRIPSSQGNSRISESLYVGHRNLTQVERVGIKPSIFTH